MLYEDRKSFFMVGAAYEKIFKSHWLKCPKTVLKKKGNMDQNTNGSKPNVWSLSINFRISGGKSQSQWKLAKKVTYFTIQFSSKNLTHFTNLNSLNIAKNILLQNSQKPSSACKFSSKHASVVCQKKHFHCTLSKRPRTAFSRHLESKCLYIPVNISEKIFVPEMWETFIWWEAEQFSSGCSLFGPRKMF